MTDQTKLELVDAVEDAIKRAGEEWSYPIVIERLRDLAEVHSGYGDESLLRGLAAALEEAIR